jgi:hypothetical protein
MSHLFEATDGSRRNLRIALFVIILATLPFYCIGFILWSVAPQNPASQGATGTPTLPPVSHTATDTPTITLTPQAFVTATGISPLQPTPLQFLPPGGVLPPPVLPPTSTPPPIFIPSSTPAPSLTPIPQATNTPVPQPTITPLPTDTPIPQPTDTPIPQPSDTPELQPTSTTIPFFPTDTPDNSSSSGNSP